MLTIRIGLGPWVLEVDAGRPPAESDEADKEPADEEPEAKQPPVPFGFTSRH